MPNAYHIQRGWVVYLYYFLILNLGKRIRLVKELIFINILEIGNILQII